MDNLKIVELNKSEIRNISGGADPWTWVLIGYVVGEVLEGIQEGISRECE